MKEKEFMIHMIRVLLLIAVGLIWPGCQPKTEYDIIKERELKSGKVVEDLFLDLRFGMGRKEFFATCWEHNKKGVLTNGAHVLQVQYKPAMPSGKDTNMFFYPSFEENKLYFMPMEFVYGGWFPGNEEFGNEKLMEDVVAFLEGWFGEGFFEVSNKSKTVKAMVKIDGNRLIRIFKKDLKSVRVEILDLRVKDIAEMNKKDEEA
ncbi:MAG: hypothetical protein LPJ98_13590 [Cyclobacteriaceae bacterium]|nr:hypothetical protein [Cyclobacteriaceae bacterium]